MSVENWNKIVDLFNEYREALECDIQKLWEDLFSDSDFFGYSRIRGEIDSQRTIQIGSSERAIPDIIIRNISENKDIFIVELKRENISSGQVQLFSYLKQLKVEIGVLVGKQIVVYAYDYKKNDKEQPFVEIKFEKNNIKGIKFLQMFSKSSFDKDSIKEFVMSHYKMHENISRIQKEFSADFLWKISRDYFQRKYKFSKNEIEEALCDYSISITNKSEVSVISQNISLDLSKARIREICNEYGYQLPENSNKFTKAKLSNGMKYWANSDVSLLKDDLWLVLEDNLKREIHVFFIPANAISESQIITRNDKKNLIDLHILYDDKKFTDAKSKIEFSKWHLKTILY